MSFLPSHLFRSFRGPYLVALIIALGCTISPVQAKEKSPRISQTVVTIDDSFLAGSVRGLADLAYRDGDEVRYFASHADLVAFRTIPEPLHVEHSLKLAGMGIDLVILSPRGADDALRGPLKLGGDFIVFSEGAAFSFAERESWATFVRNPARYLPAVGGYDLDALSRGKLVPGDPHFLLYIPEIRRVAFFESERSRNRWTGMNATDRRTKALRGIAEHDRLTGG